MQSSVIKELEGRLLQLSQDTETLGKIRSQLEQEKSVLTEKCDKLQGELIDFQARYYFIIILPQNTESKFFQEVRSK